MGSVFFLICLNCGKFRDVKGGWSFRVGRFLDVGDGSYLLVVEYILIF